PRGARTVLEDIVEFQYKRRRYSSPRWRRPLSQPPFSRCVSCCNSPASSQTPPHFSQVSIDTSSNLPSFSEPPQRGQTIEDVPAALASSATFIFSRSFSIASLFLR